MKSLVCLLIILNIVSGCGGDPSGSAQPNPSSTTEVSEQTQFEVGDCIQYTPYNYEDWEHNTSMIEQVIRIGKYSYRTQYFDLNVEKRERTLPFDVPNFKKVPCPILECNCKEKTKKKCNDS